MGISWDDITGALGEGWNFVRDPASNLREGDTPDWLNSILDIELGFEGMGGPTVGELVDTTEESANTFFGLREPYPEVSPEARAVFDGEQFGAGIMAAGLVEGINSIEDNRNQAILDAIAREQGLLALNDLIRPGTDGRTVVDTAKLQMQQNAINQTLSLGMQQLTEQYQIMQDELDRRNAQARDEIDRSRLAAIESISGLSKDLQARSADVQSLISTSAGRTAGSIAAGQEEALRRLGTANVTSGNIRRTLEEEGQTARDLAAESSDIEADLNARLSQISRDALGRQSGLVETQAAGSRSELDNLVASIVAQRAADRSASEFQLSETARQQLLELALNPPTKKVGGSKAGIYADDADLVNIALAAGVGLDEIRVGLATGRLDEVVAARSGMDAGSLTSAREAAEEAAEDAADDELIRGVLGFVGPDAVGAILDGVIKGDVNLSSDLAEDIIMLMEAQAAAETNSE